MSNVGILYYISSLNFHLNFNFITFTFINLNVHFMNVYLIRPKKTTLSRVPVSS